ncbi:MAG: hypothetical protein IJY61_08225 [Candidatus Gastranaerophilales bacterium]|nr:hypothetical protein [Candidatus Gastranaerophilales bacterium]
MNNSIYIAQNNKDTLNINSIRAFDTGAISSAINTPVSNDTGYDESEFSNNSTFFLSFIFIIFVIFLVLAFIFKKKNNSAEKKYNVGSRKERREYVREVASDEVSEQREKTSLYRYNSNRKTSLSTPTSINKCIRAFLENTQEN